MQVATAVALHLIRVVACQGNFNGLSATVGHRRLGRGAELRPAHPPAMFVVGKLAFGSSSITGAPIVTREPVNHAVTVTNWIIPSSLGAAVSDGRSSGSRIPSSPAAAHQARPYDRPDSTQLARRQERKPVLIS